MDFFFKKRKLSKGVTLIEMLAVTVIVGIIAAFSTPSLLGYWRQTQVKAAITEITGAIKETQKQASRQGRSCQIDINLINNGLTANPASCLLNNRQINDVITIRSNLSGNPPNITFSHKGSTTKSGTIVVSSPLTNLQKCFVISLGLGITRTGDYQGSPSGSVSAANCQSNN